MKRPAFNPHGKTIYIRNMSYKVTEKDLMSIFSSYGKVRYINMPMHESGKGNRGLAFIDMQVAEDADKAIKKMNGTIMDGRTIKVVEAIDKKRSHILKTYKGYLPKEAQKPAKPPIKLKPKRKKRLRGLDLLLDR